MQLISMTKPVYPAEAKAQGIEGLVRVNVLIDPKGTVTEAIEVSGPQLLRAAALEAIRQWRYKPPGVPARVTANVNYKLACKEKSPEAKPTS